MPGHRYDFNTQAALSRVDKIVRGNVREAADVIARNARREAPEITGNLKRSIKAVPEGKRFRVATESGYGAFVALGTRFSRANNFMARAWATTKAKMASADWSK